MNELKPCPFCGNVPEWDGYEPRGHEFVCRTCDLWGIRPEWWNRRVPNPPLPEAENRGYRMGIKALLDAFSDRIPKVQWLWMLQEEAERLLKESKR